MANSAAVEVRIEEVVLPTYLPALPDKNPMFLERRVYQGSSGRVYPLPVTDRIADRATDRRWKAIWMENEYLRVMVLPELGGRVHLIQDKTDGFDLIYRQEVIKPALVGLAGPWVSGGIEMNWPQHHRPATFLPVEFEVQAHGDGSKTVWCSDHDPMARMKGMHGICLHPDRAVVEIKVRVYNRTVRVQTFLWWVNVATRVHENYQSFFPPDVTQVADHAKRATSAYPLCQGSYYGVDYARRVTRGVPRGEVPAQFIPPHCRRTWETGGKGTGKPEAVRSVDYRPNDLSFYANIPVPTSYMAVGSGQDFFGGYDHRVETGLVHVANHHIAPGKKQWTWGNHEFGYAWDRNLTEAGEGGEYGPYIELMAGVYTDNQPDFSYLQPGETKAWSQYWYPIHRIGVPQQAGVGGAIAWTPERFGVRSVRRLGVAVTERHRRLRVSIEVKGKEIRSFTRDVAPANPLVETVYLPPRTKDSDVGILVRTREGRELVSYRPTELQSTGKGVAVLAVAMEPPAPADMGSADELYLTGLHLAQYRHATRSPAPYWREALRRDPMDCRCNNALGTWHLGRGEFREAQRCFERAIQRLTERNPNPYDGEAYYHLGLCLRYLAEIMLTSNRGADELYAGSYGAFYKSTWNQGWAAPGYHALSEMDCRRGEWETALRHVADALRFNTDNLRARCLQVLILRRMGRGAEAERVLEETLVLDPLDAWSRQLRGGSIGDDLQTHLDVAHDYARAGFYWEAIGVLEKARVRERDLPDLSWGAGPLVRYTMGWLRGRAGDGRGAVRDYRAGAALRPDYCFPDRLEEIGILEAAMKANPKDARAAYYLGNLLYDRRRHDEAMELWERSARIDPSFSVVWRNLGIGAFNVRRRFDEARSAYDRAVDCAPSDARLLYERDQLWKRGAVSVQERLREIEAHRPLVDARDDLSVELCALYNQTGRHEEALTVLGSRRFQPWEGGEGAAVSQYVRARIGLGQRALAEENAEVARRHFESALRVPENLGEARHVLANQSDVQYWLGCACSVLGERSLARGHWRAAATFRGDFQGMRVWHFSEMTYYSALAWERLGNRVRAREILRDLLAYARELKAAPARIDYFATSLPTLLLFDDDLEYRQRTTALFLEAQGRLGLGERKRGKMMLRQVLRRDPNHGLAAELLRS